MTRNPLDELRDTIEPSATSCGGRPARRWRSSSPTGSATRPEPRPLAEVRRSSTALVGLETVKEQVHALVAFLQVQARRRSTSCRRSRRASTSSSSATRGRGRRRSPACSPRCTARSGCSRRATSSRSTAPRSSASTSGRRRSRPTGRSGARSTASSSSTRPIRSRPEAATRLDFGPEAIEMILKRMEDYRHRLVVIVAGYPRLDARLPRLEPGSALAVRARDLLPRLLDRRAASRSRGGSRPSTSTRSAPAPRRRCGGSSRAPRAARASGTRASPARSSSRR